ncbi:ribonuclease E inhibitor RraB [Sandarakinorhabdus sp.]|uniref:ribonuclease E inhibitor RraB n=1 Tax=Sandarakinorhabdus sp. TaxID=1916663 RepID=UPI0033400AFD
MTIVRIDPEQLAEELEANEDVLTALAENGDIANIVRGIDLHFKGSQTNIEMLAGNAETLGFQFLGYAEYEDGDWAADLQIDSTTDREAISALTRRALEIEILHDVEFDGWGCHAETGLAD